MRYESWLAPPRRRADRRMRFGAGFGAGFLALTRFSAWLLALHSSAACVKCSTGVSEPVTLTGLKLHTYFKN